MATIKWAVTTDGAFDFNDPANWQFGTVPGAFDIAYFDQMLLTRSPATPPSRSFWSRKEPWI